MEKKYVDKTALEHFALKTKEYLNNSLNTLVDLTGVSSQTLSLESTNLVDLIYTQKKDI